MVGLLVVVLAVPSWGTPGAVAWTARFNGNTSRADTPSALAVSPDGTKVFVTGVSPYNGLLGADYATIAYNLTTGAKIWTKYYNSPNDLNDRPKSVTVSPDGSKVFVTGRSAFSEQCQTPDGCTDYATQALNAATGATLWVQRYHAGQSNPSDAVSVATSPDGSKVFVTGQTWSQTPGWDYLTIAYNATTGTPVWTRRYNFPGNRHELAAKLAVSPDGAKVFVTGVSTTHYDSDEDWATVAYNAANGTVLWAKAYTSATTKAHNATGMVVTPDSTKVIVSGWDYNSATSGDYVTIAYNATTGAVVWSKRLNSTGNGYDNATASGISPDGTKVFVAGSSKSDYLTVAYRSADGLFLWAARSDGPTHQGDYLGDVAVSPNGTRVYVTGDSDSAQSCAGAHSYCYDYMTVAYAATTGAIAWTSRYDGPVHGEDSAKAIGVTPNSARVLVTGASQGTGSPYADTQNADFATIAYSAT